MQPVRRRRLIHELFEASLLIKGVFAFLETVTGILLLVFGSAGVLAVARYLTVHELVEDPSDPVMSVMLGAAQNLSVGTEHFYAMYLLTHGLIKLVLVLALWRKVPFAYPAAMVVLAIFVVYQLHRWSVTGGLGLLALSAFDLVMIWLISREYRTAIRPAA